MLNFFFNLKDRFTERQGETEEGFPLLVHSLMAATAQAEPVQAQEPGPPSRSPTEAEGPKDLGNIFAAFPGNLAVTWIRCRKVMTRTTASKG